MKQMVKILVVIVITFTCAACNFLDVPDNEAQIKGEQVEMLSMTSEEHQVMQQIFTKANPIMQEYIKTFDRLSEEVILIGSQSELLAFCPDSITPPEIDFKNNCLIFAIVTTPTSQSEIRNIELYLQDNGTATFYTNIRTASMDNIVGLAFPYAVFDVSEEEIDDLKIIARRSWY